MKKEQALTPIEQAVAFALSQPFTMWQKEGNKIVFYNGTRIMEEFIL